MHVSTCKRVNITKKKICIGDLNKKITIKTRSLSAPDDSVDYEQEFTTLITPWASIQTVKGIEIFDGVNILGVATHLFYIRYNSAVTSEHFVEYNSKNFRIIDTQDLNEQNDFMVLRCSERGNKDTAANQV